MAYTTSTLLLIAGLLLPAGSWDRQDDKKAIEEAAKKAVEEFKAKTKDLKSVHEKALAIQEYGNVEPKHSSMVSAVTKYLNPSPSDINFVLPTTAAEALGKFRGIAQASNVLMGALAMYKKNPYVYSRLMVAIGKVGHESALSLFEEPLQGTDPDAAVNAIVAISEFPAAISLEVLFKEHDRIEKKKANASDALKAVYAKVQPEILKQVKRISGEPYPTITELLIWWTKRGQAFKEGAAKKEKEKKNGAPAAARTSLPPLMLVELLFKENAGQSTANSGASGGYYPTAMITSPPPAWTATAPPNGGPSGLDWPRLPGAHAVDLGGGAGVESLKNLKSFTITGWVLCKETKEGPAGKEAGGGNRIVTWLNPTKVLDGVELIYRTDGSLQLGVNQWADGSSAKSPAAQVPVIDEKATDQAAAANAAWRFFAVTYDSTGAAGHAKFYFGTRNADVKAGTAADYNRGPVGAKISPCLTIGNVAPMIRPMAPERAFRGIIDEIRIFGSTHDGSGALPVEEIIKVQNRTVPT